MRVRAPGVTGADLALQIVITAALVAQGGVGADVTDTDEPNAPMPYVLTGDNQVVPTPADGQDRAVEVHTTLHVYTVGTSGGREARTIAGVLVDRLDHAALDLGPDWQAVEIYHTGTRVLDDPDGSKHAVITFTTLLDPA